MRTHLLTMSLAALLGLGAAACGDDDGDNNQNNNNNNSTMECGNGVAEGSEICDGVDHRSNDCSTVGMGFTGGTLACNATCTGWVVTGCAASEDCGNDTVDTGETCDGSNLNNQDCTTIGAGYTGGTLACNSTCTGFVFTGCTTLVDCGNNTVDTGETCDGSDLDGEDCTTIGGGFTGGTLACNSACDGWVTTGCTTTAGGDSCAAPGVITGNTTIAGSDITADYTDQQDLQDASCDGGYGVPEAGAVEAVFEVALAAGQTLLVENTGGLDAYFMVVSTCANSSVCAAVADEPESLSYTATAAETVYVIAGAYSANPTTTDYAFEFSFPVCGNGIVEGSEQCDDINGTPVSGDGCSALCEVEFGYECDNTSTSVCTPYPAFGTFNGACETDIVHTGGALAADAFDSYNLVLTAPATVTGTVTSPDGDIDFYVINQNGGGYSFETTGNESVSLTLPAGNYLLVAYAYDAVSAYTITLGTACPEDLGSVGNGGAVNQVEAAMAAQESYYYTITLTEDVMVSGTLTSTSGDPDFWVYGAGGYVTGHGDDGNETIGLALQAGTYTFEVQAYTAVPDFTLTLAFTSLAVTDIGSFAAGDAIANTVGGPLAERIYAHYTITFTDDVLLSGTLGGNTTGELFFVLYDASRNYVTEFAAGGQTWTDEPVSAGTYIVQVQTYSTVGGGGPVDAYTLTMSTTTP